MKIIRIVRMAFRPSEVPTFLAVFEQAQPKIRAFEGCSHVQLHQDQQTPSVYYTYSVWDSEEHLNKYRHSALFNTTWEATKVLFSDKPMAFSLQKEPITAFV